VGLVRRYPDPFLDDMAAGETLTIEVFFFDPDFAAPLRTVLETVFDRCITFALRPTA